ncbi:MAG: asparagine synthase (glutamine-hydrolyzing) [Anaerolineae bacterium]|nr:asparagine synthase (glutamine-hydrolyzing) [Anaerolineae bacterium]
MCGIVGTLNLTRDGVIDPALLQRMLGTLRHRGPEQYGIYVYQNAVGLGNARLSIIDLSGGQQPISNSDGTLWIVCNGEIFNYIELRAALEAQGHRFTTASDVQVVVQLYERYGPACLEYLNGQFAFAIWDERAHSLFIARDRLGIRPLYYTVQAGALIFASEIKALLADPRVPAALDPVALDEILTFWSPLSPRTAFEGVRTLPPGHWMLVGPDDEMCIRRYWALSFPEDVERDGAAPDRSLQECAQQLKTHLVEATQIRLRADVPVGAYLSGGLDSSTITTLIHHHAHNQLETFSIAFTDEAFDESVFQRQMAKHLGTRHHLITCTHADIGRVFPEVIWHTEVPIMRTSPAPMYLLSRLVHDHHFKVVLTGEGADEFLAGYNIFKEAKIRRFWAREPQSTWRPMLLKKLYPYISGLEGRADAFMVKFFGQGLVDVAAADYSHAIRWCNTSRTKRLFSKDMKARLVDAPAGADALIFPEEFARWTPLARAQYLEITIFMAEYLLSSQGDRVAMAHSVEGRFPFLDHRVVAFCNQLPPHYKLRGLDEKHILKQAVRDLLPEAIWHRPKRPYRAPIHRSFFPAGEPLEWVAELLSPGQIAAAGYFDPAAVANLVKKISRWGELGETDDMALAGILSTQLVHRQFVTDYQPGPALNERDDVKWVLRR